MLVVMLVKPPPPPKVVMRCLCCTAWAWHSPMNTSPTSRRTMGRRSIPREDRHRTCHPVHLTMLMVGVLLAVLAAGYLGVVLFYYVLQERFIFLRIRTRQGHQYTYKTPFEERRITAPDGARLHALYFKADKPRGVVLYFHGNAGSLRRWGRFAPRFTTLGYEVLMPDPRGYGKSRGDLSEAALIG